MYILCSILLLYMYTVYRECSIVRPTLTDKVGVVQESAVRREHMAHYRCIYYMHVWHMPHRHLSSHRSQEQQLLLSSLKLFYRPDSINYHRPYSCKHCSSQHHYVPSDGPSFTQFLVLLLPMLILFSQLPSHYQVTSQQVSPNQEAPTSPCMKTALKISHMIFIAETSFWAAIALARLSVPPRALHRHTRVPCKLSEESRADYQTLLALLLIANCDAFSTRLLLWRLQYFLLHIKPPWNSDNYFIAEISFWPRIALINTVHPQMHFKSTQECHTLSRKNPGRTNASYGASLIADGDALLATSAPLPGPFSSVFSALPICYVCRHTILACPFTL